MKKIKSNQKIKSDNEILFLIKDKFKKFNKSTFKTTEVIFLIIVTAIIGIIIGTFLNKNNIQSDEYLGEIIDNYNYINENYYETVDKNKLISGAVEGMLSSLDDEYSELLGEDNSSFYRNLEGSYDGIGIEIYNDENGNVVVLGVIDNSPALKAGIEKGDIIKKIDDKSFENTNIKELTNYISNSEKKEYDVVVSRNNDEISLKVKKENVTIKSVSSKIIEKENRKIGYIYISIFSNTTPAQFKKALTDLEKENIDSLIIDVRENTGGHLTTAVSLLSNLLDKSKVIYQIEKNNKKVKYYSNGYETKNYPIVVIQNKNSASASEILSAALKESYGATIVGETSYGKGTVQELNTLSNGDKYKFTAKKWLTPSGKWINKVGIKPDINVSLDDNYYNNPNDDNDNQLQAAIDSLLKKSN